MNDKTFEELLDQLIYESKYLGQYERLVENEDMNEEELEKQQELVDNIKEELEHRYIHN